MTVRFELLGIGVTLALSFLLLACGSKEPSTPTPTEAFISTEQIPLGTYALISNGDKLELQLRDDGRYSMFANGDLRRAGTYTLGTRRELLFDDRTKPDICPDEVGYGKYTWELKRDKLSFKEVAEVTNRDGTTHRGDECDGRRDDLQADAWVYEPGSFPPPKAAP